MILKRLSSGGFIVLLAAGLCACSQDTESPETEAAEQAVFSSAVQVRLAAVEQATLNSKSQLTGTVEAFRKATVAAEVGGRVRKRLIEPGAVLAAGQSMIVLDNTQPKNAHREAKALLTSRRVDLQSAQSELQRGRELIAKAFISKDDLEDLEFAVQNREAQLQAAEAAMASAAKALADTAIQAPFAGTAEIVHVQEGDYLNPGQAVVTLADFSRLRLRAGVTAAQAAEFTPGTEAEVGFSALGQEPVTGQVHSVSRIAEGSTGSYPLEIWLDGKGLEAVREGMIASIHMDNGQQAAALVVPKPAVFQRFGKAHVFVVVGDVAQLSSVTIGRSDARFTEITSGLQQGQMVVTEGQFSLRDGGRVAVLQ